MAMVAQEINPRRVRVTLDLDTTAPMAALASASGWGLAFGRGPYRKYAGRIRVAKARVIAGRTHRRCYAPFKSRAYQAQYCSARCRQAVQKRRYRERKRWE